MYRRNRSTELGVSGRGQDSFREFWSNFRLRVRAKRRPIEFINCVIVRSSALSEQRMASILLMECSTVVWCLPPNSQPISSSDAPVSCLAMYMAIWRPQGRGHAAARNSIARGLDCRDLIRKEKAPMPVGAS
jgi:hypothetical protein